MKLVNIHILLYTLLAAGLLCPYYALSQKPDTTNLYYRIHKKAQKHKVTEWIYDGIFRDPIVKHDTFPVIRNSKKKNPYLVYQGKVVRNIRVISLDPFGFSVNDTLKELPNKTEALANRYHVNTRRYIIRNILLFKSNKKLDPLEISESERLLRLSPYINDARIYVSGVKSRKNKDSVDVVVVVQDKWSTIIGSSLDPVNPDIKIIERNLFGLGHHLEEGVTWRNSDQEISSFGKYTVFNVSNTFVNASTFYTSAKTNTQWGVALDRPFYSALAKWAGGASYTRNYTLKEFPADGETEDIPVYPVNFHTKDIWIAKNFPVTRKKMASIDKRSSNYVLGLRYYQENYFARPSFSIDINRLNRDQTMLLNNLGFSKREYYKDRYLFRFGANEDIPEGYSVEYVHGIVNKEASSLWYYSGLKFATGRHYDHLGYLSAGMSYGTFYNKTFSGLGTVNADVYYFSDLFAGGRWFFRQFSRLQYTQGIDRMAYESVTINGNQMYGFSSDVLSGKSKAILNLEFVMYAPYQFIGFKFAPVLLCGFARTGDAISDLLNGHTYQAYALGLLIRNEYLISSTFEISIGLYPYVPGTGSYLIQLDPVGSYNVKARDYNIGKPELVPYQ
ncbi:MAG: hypothetical protein V4590_06440 [Bacteroidota bacterium]